MKSTCDIAASVFVNCHSGIDGGAMHVESACSIRSSSFVNCSVLYKADSWDIRGGAVYVPSTCSVTDSVFIDCSVTNTGAAYAYGGAIYSKALDIMNSRFQNCFAVSGGSESHGTGGALHASTECRITNTTLMNCTAAYGEYAGNAIDAPHDGDFACQRCGGISEQWYWCDGSLLSESVSAPASECPAEQVVSADVTDDVTVTGEIAETLSREVVEVVTGEIAETLSREVVEVVTGVHDATEGVTKTEHSDDAGSAIGVSSPSKQEVIHSYQASEEISSETFQGDVVLTVSGDHTDDANITITKLTIKEESTVRSEVRLIVNDTLVMSGSSELSSTVGITITSSCSITFQSAGSALPILKVQDSTTSETPRELIVSIDSTFASISDHVLVQGVFDCNAWKENVKLQGSASASYDLKKECKDWTGSRVLNAGSYQLVVGTSSKSGPDDSKEEDEGGLGTTVIIIIIVVAVVVVIVVIVVIVVVVKKRKKAARSSSEDIESDI